MLLEDQDRSLWDQTLIAEAGELIGRAASMRRLGAHQLQAASPLCTPIPIVGGHGLAADRRSLPPAAPPSLDTPVVRLTGRSRPAKLAALSAGSGCWTSSRSRWTVTISTMPHRAIC